MWQMARSECVTFDGNDLRLSPLIQQTLKKFPLVHQALQRLPGLLDSASTCEVLSVSGPMQRMVQEDDVSAMFPRSHSLPLNLSAKNGKPNQSPKLRQKFRDLVWLVFLFVVLDASKSLGVSWAAVHGHICAPLVICAKNLLSIVCGMSLALLLDGTSGIRQCMNIARALKVLPIAGCFCAAQMFALQASRFFDAGSLKVIAQINLPMTAFLSWLLLGRRKSVQHWVAVAMLFITTVAFLQVRMLFYNPRPDANQTVVQSVSDKVAGMTYFLLGISISCIASIFAELFLQKPNEAPYYIQKTNLMFGEFLSALLMVRFKVSSDTTEICSWQEVQDWHQLPVILVWLIHGWTAGILVKRCSVLLKNVCHIMSALVTYFVPLLFFKGEVHFWPVTLSGVLVLSAVLVFATVPKERDTKGLKRSIHRRARDDGDNAKLRYGRSQSAVCLKAPHFQPNQRAGSGPCTGDVDAHFDASANTVSPISCDSTSCIVQVKGRRATSAPVTPCHSLKPRDHHGMSLGLLILSFIFLDATKPVLLSWAQQNKAPGESFNQGTFVLVQTALSLLIGLTIAISPSISLEPLRIDLHPAWRRSLLQCLDMSSVLKRIPVSCCLCFSKLLLIMALKRLDAGTVRVFGQASLPFVGISTALFFSRRYTLQQWCSLAAISVALVTFYHVKSEVHRSHETIQQSGRHVGMFATLLVLGSIGFNCLGALLVEKFLKHNRASLHEQKAQLLLGEVLVNAVMVIILPYATRNWDGGIHHAPLHRGFFAGWDNRVVICMLVWIPAGWTATMIVKRCSNLLKTVAQGTSSVLTYVFSLFPVTLVGPPLTPEPFSSPVVLLAIAVMLSALTFAGAGENRNERSGSSTDKELQRRTEIHGWTVDKAYAALVRRPQFDTNQTSSSASMNS